MMSNSPPLKALCVGRHEFLADHYARFFADLGVATRSAAGFQQALSEAQDFEPDIVICEYDLLTRTSLALWESDELLSRCPVIAVSLSRRPNEAHLLDINTIAGFLYLPGLDRAAATRLLNAAAGASRNGYTSPLDSVSAIPAVQA
jgi:hypothetical protein